MVQDTRSFGSRREWRVKKLKTNTCFLIFFKSETFSIKRLELIGGLSLLPKKFFIHFRTISTKVFSRWMWIRINRFSELEKHQPVPVRLPRPGRDRAAAPSTDFDLWQSNRAKIWETKSSAMESLLKGKAQYS